MQQLSLRWDCGPSVPQPTPHQCNLLAKLTSVTRHPVPSALSGRFGPEGFATLLELSPLASKRLSPRLSKFFMLRSAISFCTCLVNSLATFFAFSLLGIFRCVRRCASAVALPRSAASKNSLPRFCSRSIRLFFSSHSLAFVRASTMSSFITACFFCYNCVSVLV